MSLRSIGSPLTLSSAGEICVEWQTWSEYFNIHNILAQSILQSFFYIILAVRTLFITPQTTLLKSDLVQIVFAGSAAVLVKSYAP